MPPSFSQENLHLLAVQWPTIPGRAQELISAFTQRPYATELGREYALHGAARRIGTLARCVDQVFRQMPPEQEGIPTKEVREDVTIYIQAFVFNVFGVLDNLAYVWVNEQGVVGNTGRPLPNGRIGLTKDKEQVWQSLPAPLQEYLEGFEDWFANLESFRHSLGHRISLYIPPYNVDPRNADRFQALEADEERCCDGTTFSDTSNSRPKGRPSCSSDRS